MADERFTQGQETAPLRLGQKIGTRDLSRTAGIENREFASSTSKLRREAVSKETPDYINAVKALRDALAQGNDGQENGIGYREATPAMTITVEVDASGSMSKAMDLKSWAQGALKGDKVIDKEDTFLAITQSANAEFESGLHGKVDFSIGVFGLPERGTLKAKKPGEQDRHVDFTQPQGDSTRPQVISGDVMGSPNETVSKIIKPRSLEWDPSDGDMTNMILRESGMRGNATFLDSLLQLRKNELARDPQFAEEVKTGKRAVIHFIMTDGLIHNASAANALAKDLADAGVFIIPVVIGGDREGMRNMEALAPGHVIDGDKNASDLSKGIEKLAENVRQNGRQGGSRRQSEYV